jgi:hypothetical protein
MILLQHLAERANAVTAAVLLSKLAQLHFCQIALDRLLEEFLAGFVLGEGRRTHDEPGGNAGHQQPNRHGGILQYVVLV